VPEAVAELRAEEADRKGDDARVVIASYLLAPGFFHDQLAKAGADAVTAPLLPAPVIAQIVLDRYDAALAAGRVAGHTAG
jgi:sirohydrochlorin ferrochelatase